MGKKLKITGGVLLVLVALVFLLAWDDNDIKESDKIGNSPEAEKLEFAPESTEAPTLEEIAEKSSKSIEDLIPEPSEVPTLEEQAEKEDKDITDFVPEPTGAAPLE